MTRADLPHRFRMKLWPWLVFGVVCILVFNSGYLLWRLYRRPAGGPSARGIAAGHVAAMSRSGFALLGAMAVYVWWYRVRVGPAGLRGYDLWSVPRTLGWDEVGRVRPVLVAGLPFVRVFGTGPGRPVWVPLFVTDPEGLADRLAEFAGPDHPLTQAAAARLPAE